MSLSCVVRNGGFRSARRLCCHLRYLRHCNAAASHLAKSIGLGCDGLKAVGKLQDTLRSLSIHFCVAHFHIQLNQLLNNLDVDCCNGLYLLINLLIDLLCGVLVTFAADFIFDLLSDFLFHLLVVGQFDGISNPQYPRQPSC